MRQVLRVFLLACLLAGCQPGSDAGTNGVQQSQSDSHEIAKEDLPPEARDTLRAIVQGGPFADARDGVVFGNFEHALPKQPRGYYHEYTVRTPSKHSRGIRRIVSGSPGEYYYSADQYQTFRRIRE